MAANFLFESGVYDEDKQEATVGVYNEEKEIA